MARRTFEFSSNHVYWLVVFALTACTVFFASNVQQRRKELRSDRSVQIESGATVELVRIIDGDEVSVRGEGGGTFVVRLLGVKGFSTAVNEPGLSGLGQIAVQAMEGIVEDKEIHVVFDELKFDRSGRLLAYLEAEDHDVGEQMIRLGHLVAYIRYPFSREELYLGAQAEAKTSKKGLWGNYKAVSRVQGWQDTWRNSRQQGEAGQ